MARKEKKYNSRVFCDGELVATIEDVLGDKKVTWYMDADRWEAKQKKMMENVTDAATEMYYDELNRTGKEIF